MTDNVVLERVRRLVEPIVSDLGLDLYDLEFRGGTLRVTLDTRPGSDGGINLEAIALATRLISRDLDHEDPVPGHYTLEVTSPGLERTLRTPAHFRREIGKTVAVRLRDIGEGGQRRIQGILVAATDEGATVRLDELTSDQPSDEPSDQPLERTIAYSHIDRAKTVFTWEPTPKPGGGSAGKRQRQPSGAGHTTSRSTATASRSPEEEPQ